MEANMETFQSEMNQTVHQFVAQITELARRAALDTLESAFGSPGAPRAAVRAAPVGAAPVPPSGRPRGTRGAKRTSEDIESMAMKAAAFIKSNPGLRIEQINKELGTTTKDLALPMRKLISDGLVATKGQKRSTTYFAGKKSK
jgi:hypothetical protein